MQRADKVRDKDKTANEQPHDHEIARKAVKLQTETLPSRLWGHGGGGLLKSRARARDEMILASPTPTAETSHPAVSTAHTIGKAERRVAEAEVTELFDEHEIATRVEELARMAVDRTGVSRSVSDCCLVFEILIVRYWSSVLMKPVVAYIRVRTEQQGRSGLNPVDPFVLHPYAALSEKERAVIRRVALHPFVRQPKGPQDQLARRALR